jgi:hypothetical protein
MTDIRLIEYEPGKWRVDRREIPVARSALINRFSRGGNHG